MKKKEFFGSISLICSITALIIMRLELSGLNFHVRFVISMICLVLCLLSMAVSLIKKKEEILEWGIAFRYIWYVIGGSYFLILILEMIADKT